MTPSLRIALLLDPLAVSLNGPMNLRVKWGGHASKLAREFLGRGHHVRGFGAPPGLIPRSSEDPEETEWSWSKLKAFRPDVVVSYDALSPAAMRGARMARKTGATLMLVESALPGGGRFYERGLHRIGEWLWGRFVRRTVGGLVAVDQKSREHALREGFDADLIRVIPHGVDISDFRPGLSSPLVSRHHIRGRILLYVGKLEPSRGVDTLIAAFARTVGQRSDWNLVLAGSGYAAPALHAQTRRLGMGDRVHWLPRPRREELPGLMGVSTMLAVPALDDTVVGRYVGRALACGLPVLATDRPRLSGLVQHDKTGLIVGAGDVDQWTEAITRAASSPVARKRWSEAARRFAESNLAWAKIASDFEEEIVRARERVHARLHESGRFRRTRTIESYRES